jgi:uncharacterized protein
MSYVKPRKQYGFVPTAQRYRQRLQNASVTGYSGSMDVSDRGYGTVLPMYTDNPYTSQDYLYRWRQYVMMYETSWEARKICRIIPEDALRKEWVAEDIPEEMAHEIQGRLNQLQFIEVLKRSLILERLLGGCLTFLGIEDVIDDPSREYIPEYGFRLRFVNSLPISRISRTSWETNPLSEHYMRPESYLINGETVHRSRFLVWDGSPLFDPLDFTLTNFRANIAGFGPSVLASVWDDIVKAVGTRQAAYQMVQTNNAIIAMVSDLQDLMGTSAGKTSLQKIKDIANQLSLYRAAMIDGEKVELSQHSASFGSVPELIITYLQVLSAGSDIPATRFLSQAPGGLNATGESDLENYYNVIDAFQHQHIEPELRKIYDVIGFEMFPNEWRKARENLTFNFPPLWNLSELEEAQRGQLTIDNVIKLLQERIISEERAIEELNLKGVLSVHLDSEDVSLLSEFHEEQSQRDDMMAQQPFGQPQQQGFPPSQEGKQPMANMRWLNDAKWDESQHERADDGKFGKGGGKTNGNEDMGPSETKGQEYGATSQVNPKKIKPVNPITGEAKFKELVVSMKKMAGKEDPF